MNQHLETILKLIRQSEPWSADERNSVTKAVEEAAAELESKNRELEIEASLERVRTIAMSMMQASHMLEVCKMISSQLQLLGVKEIRNVQTAIFHEEKGIYYNYEYYAKHDKTVFTETDYKNHPVSTEFAERMLKGAGEIFIHSFNKKGLKEWIKYQKTTNVFIDSFLETAPSLNYYWYSLGPVALGLSTYLALSDDEINLFKRFKNVFELSYRRYLDIEQAYAQAEEAKLEASLEKVRAQAMAMHTTDELKRVGETIFYELKSFGFSDLRNTEIIINKDEKESVLSYYCDYGVCGTMEVGYKTNPILEQWANDLKKASDAFVSVVISEKEMPAWRKFREEIGYQPDPKLNGASSVYYYSYSTGLGALSVSSFAPITDEQMKMLGRFRNVFALAYRRYADVSLAEAQAREAQIELALERVRARTMAMQHSDELSETAQVLFQQFNDLGAKPIQITIGIFNEEENVIEFRSTDPLGTGARVDHAVKGSLEEPTLLKKIYVDWKEGKKSTVIALAGKELSEWVKYRITLSGVPDNKDYSDARRVVYVGFFSKGMLSVSSIDDPSRESVQLLERFAAVFDLTYTRFLDLKQAEAQVREAKIEAALERVRSRTMGMQKSEELKEVIQVVYEQFVHLNINIKHTGFVIDYKARDDYDIWIADPLGVPSQVTIPYFDSVYYNRFNEAKEKGEDFFATNLTLEEKNKFYQKLFEYVPGLPEESKEFYFNCPGLAISTVLLENVGLYIENFSGTPYTDEENTTLMRFGKVFQQTYTRFLDLQKAEAQAKEAQIEASLERVRGRAMAMHSSEDLSETVNVFFKELKTLGITPIRCGVGQVDEETHTTDLTTTTASQQGESVHVVGKLKQAGHPVLEGIYDHWKLQKEYHPVLRGEDIKAYYAVTKNQIAFPEYDEHVTQYGNQFPFKEGFVYAWTEKELSEEELKVFRRFTSVLSLTYTRFNDLQVAEAQAKQALIEEQKLREEKKRSDALLLNILPEEIANELKQFGKSYARKHDEVTVLFADIKGFSTIAENLSAEELVNQLDECFRAFDHIVEKHGLEKIKTVGDAYVCACGLPKPVIDNATKAVRAAIDMMNFIKGFAITKTIQDLPAFEFRVGIHTGPVVTGVVGLKKFTYDIWGDAVNMAARMEQHGEAGRINISESTHALIKDKFKCTPRGKIQAKNKGEVEMYFVEHQL